MVGFSNNSSSGSGRGGNSGRGFIRGSGNSSSSRSSSGGFKRFSSGGSSSNGGSSERRPAYRGGSSYGNSGSNSDSRSNSSSNRGGSYRGGDFLGGSSRGDSNRGNSERPAFNRERSSSDRPGFSRGGSNRGGFSRGGFSRGGFNSRPRSRQNRNTENIDQNKFIKQAKPVTEESAYKSTNTFADFNLVPTLTNNLFSKHFETPTPIQDQAIPFILEGKDLVGIANTGTGKTGAFLIPLINKIALDHSQKVLIIAPTRELAVQIQEDLLSFSRSMQMFSVLVVGGQSMYNQINGLKRQHSFVIGTPGRIIDLIKQRKLHLGAFKNIVLDEVDRMLDMGFIQDITSIINELPAERQSLFFSATMAPKIERIMKTFVHDYKLVSVRKTETSDNVEQNIVETYSRDEKFTKLKEIIQKFSNDKILVFMKTKIGADKIQQKLQRENIDAVAIHGNKAQSQRLRALNDFKTGKCRVMIATDVAARGLDIPNVGHVINYDVPATHDDYIHRIGRTGRAGKKGNALTFIEKFTMDRR